MPVKSVTFTMPGRLCLGSCNDRFSFFPVEIPATVLRTRPVTCILFRPYGGTASRVRLLLGRLPLLHQAPVFRISRRLDDVTTVAGSPFSQTSLPSPGPKVSVGPRFECLQTKRCALLWSVSYPCSIFHTLVSRFTTL